MEEGRQTEAPGSHGAVVLWKKGGPGSRVRPHGVIRSLYCSPAMAESCAAVMGDTPDYLKKYIQTQRRVNKNVTVNAFFFLYQNAQFKAGSNHMTKNRQWHF